MRRADVLAMNQSTFSFSAALLSRTDANPDATPTRAEADATPALAPAVRRFWRPEPAAGALVPCDPWDAPVLLNACGSGTAFRRADADADADADVEATSDTAPRELRRGAG